MFYNSGFKRTLCGGAWESLTGPQGAFTNLGSSGANNNCPFKPVDSAALKVAVGTCDGYGVCTGGCLGETADGSCPTFAATNVPGTSNPYGVMGDWDTSLVTDMKESKL